jgi:hypothetical protein
MKRREFLVNTARGLVSAWVASRVSGDNAAWAENQAPLPQKFNAHDTVTLGSTGIQTSRLAMGTGTHGFSKSSDQVRLGMATLTALLLNGYASDLRMPVCDHTASDWKEKDQQKSNDRSYSVICADREARKSTKGEQDDSKCRANGQYNHSDVGFHRRPPTFSGVPHPLRSPLRAQRVG